MISYWHSPVAPLNVLDAFDLSVSGLWKKLENSPEIFKVKTLSIDIAIEGEFLSENIQFLDTFTE